MGVTDLRYSLSDVPRRGQLRISVRRDVNNTHPGLSVFHFDVPLYKY
jgi:hypothetical protein